VRTSSPDAQRDPIVFVHGLGEAVLDSDIVFFGSLSASRRDVYLYDQVGCGLSDRLSDIAAYTVERHVRDLEAIREVIGADRLILIAHADGAAIAVRYMIRHPDRVARVVFYSPAALWEDPTMVRDTSRTGMSLLSTLFALDVRPNIALALAYYSPQTAQAYVPQAELSGWADRTTDEGVMVCPGDQDLAPDPSAPGYNLYAEAVGRISYREMPDPRERLADSLTPTILLRGSCDPVDEAVVAQYQGAIPYLQTIYVEDAGSMLHLTQPDTVARIILVFLPDEG
jgi:proline iminopeptidase